jgi:hypothetical protein
MTEPGTTRIDDLEDPEEGAVWREMPRSFTVRRRLKLSVEEFAERYWLPADLLHAWEAGTATPDAVARAFLLAIAREPELIAQALAPREPRVRPASANRDAAE